MVVVWVGYALLLRKEKKTTNRMAGWLEITFFSFLMIGNFHRIAMHEERNNKHKDKDSVPEGAVPTYLLEREGVNRAKVLSNTVKQKRKEKAGKWSVSEVLRYVFS